MTRRTHIGIVAAALAALALTAGPALARVPERPEEISFDELIFEPPMSDQFKHELSNGVTVYVAPSHEFPLVNFSLSFKGGAYLEPSDKVGLAGVTGEMIRRGGTTTVSAEELDEQFDFLAANVSSYMGTTTSGANLNCLKSNLDEAFALFIDMVRNPGFDTERLRIVKDERLERMKQRNDDANSILAMEWDRLMWGEDHFEGRIPTQQSIESITVADMQAFHQKIFNPNNLIIAVTGDVVTSEVLERLEGALDGWPMGERMPDPPAPMHEPEPGLYHVEKDIPQAKFRMGHKGIERDDPDYFSVVVMNDILGGGGFTSRLMKKIRSDEGLTYGINSQYQNRVWYPGEFRVSSFSKNPTLALTIKLAEEEMERVQAEGVTEKELETSKKSFIEVFPRTFESKAGMLNVFVSDQWTDRDPQYWQNYRDNIRKVSLNDVQRVAREHMDPDNMVILVVGKWDEIYKGDIDGRASMAEFYDGNADHRPLRDPLTLQPMKDGSD